MATFQGIVGAAEPGNRLTNERAPLFRKLKPGPGLPADEVFADQRRRLQGAMLALVGQEGCESVKIRTLAHAAGVSTATFYKHFTNVEDCVAATYDAVLDATVSRSTAAGRSHSDWEDSLRASATALIEAIAKDGLGAQLALIEIYAAGPKARRKIGRTTVELEKVISGSLSTAPRGIAAPRHLVVGMTAGLLQVARKTVLAGRTEELHGVASEISEWVVSLPHPEVRSLLSTVTALKKRGRQEETALPGVPEPNITSVQVDDRSRLLRTALKLAASEGIPGITGPRLRAEASVTKKQFEKQFESVEECVLDSIEGLLDGVVRIGNDWSYAEGTWEKRTCTFVSASCGQAARDHAGARLAFVGILGAGRTGMMRRHLLISRAASKLRATVPADQRPSQVVAEASVGAAWAIVQADVLAGRTRDLPTTAPLLSYAILAPIVGPRTAVAAVRRATPGELQAVA